MFFKQEAMLDLDGRKIKVKATEVDHVLKYQSFCSLPSFFFFFNSTQ